MSRAFHRKLEMQAADGSHLRWIPGSLGRALVDAGTAVIAAGNGKVKSIRLVETASGYGTRIGEPDARLPLNTRFIKRIQSEAGSTYWEFHRRSCDYD